MIEISDKAEREEAARLFEAMKEAQDAFDGFEGPHLTFEHAEVHAEYRRRMDALHAWHNEALAAHDHPDLLALEKKMQAARKAYFDVDGPAILEDEDGNMIRCALTGVPLCDDDEVVSDDATGEVMLRCATGLPPRELDEEADQEVAA